MKNKLLLVFILFGAYYSNAQTFYDLNTIQTIEITFAESNWDALLDTAEATDAYIAAQSISINGVTYNNIGVKYKGNSSYNPNQVKNPFHIELNTYVDQNYQGYTDIKLSNVIFDPTFIREALGYKILGNYMDVPKANYAKLYVNGTYIGLYTNVESISKSFVDDKFGSKTNAFFDCSPPAGAGPTTTNLPNLAYLGTSSASYTSAYDMKSLSGWDDLIALTNTLSTTTSTNTANIEAILDVDRALWMLAFDNVFVNLDSYIGRFKQNYYLYKSNNGQFMPIVWDLNMCFGVFGDTGSAGGNLTTATKKNMSHTLHSTEAAWPLVQKLLAVPTYKKKYIAHYKTILSEVVSSSGSNYFLTDAQTLQALINTAVTADTNKFSYQTTTNMTNNLNSTDVSVAMNTAPGINGLMAARYTNLTALTDFTNTQPTISNIVVSNTSPAIGTSVNVTAAVTNTNYVYLGYRSNRFEKFTKIQMFDDGAHNDGANNDGVYGISMPVTTIYTQYYFYAENTNVGRFSPARAEHEFYTVTGTYPTLTPGTLVVNEIMAQNTSTVTDPAGDYSDWFELYNNSSNTISLDNLYASDSSTNLLKWEFPLGLTMEPYSYLIVWADQDLTQTGLHADFKFSSGGENCILSYPNGTIIENVSFGIQTANMGYARNPNGTGSFVIQAPTFNANNETPLSTENFEGFENSLVLYPNPTSNIINISNNAYVIESVVVANLQGQVLFQSNGLNQNSYTIDLSGYASGMYIINVNKQTNIKIIKK
jgi:hypothetical protein